MNLALSVIHKLALEAAYKGLMLPQLAAGIARLKGATCLGTRMGTWLTRERA